MSAQQQRRFRRLRFYSQSAVKRSRFEKNIRATFRAAVNPARAKILPAAAISAIVIFGLAGCARDTRPAESARGADSNAAFTAIAPLPAEGAGARDDQTYVLKIDNDKALRIEDYDLLWKDYLARVNPAPDAKREALRATFHQELIQNYLLLHEARRVGIQLTPEYKLQRLLQDNQLQIRLLKQKIQGELSATAEEIEHYYREHLDELSTPARVQVRHILLESAEEAQKILARLNQGEDFAALAREFSKHPSNVNGGALPPFSRGAYSATFEDAAFALKVGERSGIVKTELGYHLIEQTSFQPKKVPRLDEARAEIERKLLEKKYAEQFNLLIERLRREAGIEEHFPAEAN